MCIWLPVNVPYLSWHYFVRYTFTAKEGYWLLRSLTFSYATLFAAPAVNDFFVKVQHNVVTHARLSVSSSSPTAHFVVHHVTYGISSLLHCVNLILFTLLLVHLAGSSCRSPHHSPCLQSSLLYYHLSLPRSFNPDLKPMILYSIAIWFHLDCLHWWLDLLGTGVCLF